MNMVSVFLLHRQNLLKQYLRNLHPPRARGSISGSLPPTPGGEGGGITSAFEPQLSIGRDWYCANRIAQSGGR